MMTLLAGFLTWRVTVVTMIPRLVVATIRSMAVVVLVWTMRICM